MVIYVTLTILTENGKLSLFSCKLRVLFFFFQRWIFLLLVFVFAILSCLFLAALWSPVGKGLAYLKTITLAKLIKKRHFVVL